MEELTSTVDASRLALVISREAQARLLPNGRTR